MSLAFPESAHQSKLRLNAEARLKEGSAPPTSGWPTGVSALSLLHRLASAPESADDALKLLHELQVHQVELDLQHEQMDITQRELAEDLAHYQALYRLAPVAYLSVGPAGDILESNVAAASLFGVAPDELRGRHIDVSLAPDSRPVFLAMLQRLRAGAHQGVCEAQLAAGSISRRVRIVASSPASGEFFLLILVDTTDCRQPDPRA